MKGTSGHLVRNIGSLVLVLTAGCGGADALARTAGDCQSADRHLSRCGIALDDPNICAEEKDAPVRPVMTLDQAECIKKFDCGELRGKAKKDSEICDVNVKLKYTDSP